MRCFLSLGDGGKQIQFDSGPQRRRALIRIQGVENRLDHDHIAAARDQVHDRPSFGELVERGQLLRAHGCRVLGIDFDPQVMRESIYKAGLAEPSAAVGFMIRCYHYDPGANSHARAGVLTLRIGAAIFAIVLFSALGVLHFMRRAKRSVSAAPNGVP